MHSKAVLYLVLNTEISKRSGSYNRSHLSLFVCIITVSTQCLTFDYFHFQLSDDDRQREESCANIKPRLLKYTDGDDGDAW